MQNLIQINRVSEFFFLLLGSAYLFAFLSWKNNFHSFASEIFLRLADIPFALFAISFGVTSFALSLHDQYSDPQTTPINITDKILLGIGIVFFLIIAIIDIFVPTSSPLPILS